MGWSGWSYKLWTRHIMNRSKTQEQKHGKIHNNCNRHRGLGNRLRLAVSFQSLATLPAIFPIIYLQIQNQFRWWTDETINHASDKSLFPQAFFSLDSLVVINLAVSSRGFQVRRLDFVTVGVGSKDLGPVKRRTKQMVDLMGESTWISKWMFPKIGKHPKMDGL